MPKLVGLSSLAVDIEAVDADQLARTLGLNVLLWLGAALGRARGSRR